ncbi:MAG: phospho-N-acetylmuramoyl-pentapeptide-transferase [Campylobacterales bacterium]|nr:phospho-N-acetylmuramoyl-pentapeptide-transferase [Campylobacterales bacterium]
MIYFLSELLPFHLFSYISVRAGIAFFIGLALTLYLMPKYIQWAKAKNANQPINKYVTAHEGKSKTPTMGGAVFLFASVLAILISGDITNLYLLGGLFVVIGFGFIGLKDDLGKVLSGDNLKGLSPRGKFILQIVIASLVSIFLVIVGFPTDFYVPFLKTPLFDISYFMIIFWIVIFLATTNAVNLTDGLDGLATVPSIVAFASLGLITYVTGHAIFSEYLLVPNIKGVGEMAIIVGAFMGALFGFLWFNCYPAEIFMGDTGSLSIGGLIAYLAILGKSEVLLVLIGIIFVSETASVILQVGSYKLRGERIFLMAPIHHHFELKKWAENKIIVRFWMIAVLANVLALISFKFR